MTLHGDPLPRLDAARRDDPGEHPATAGDRLLHLRMNRIKHEARLARLRKLQRGPPIELQSGAGFAASDSVLEITGAKLRGSLKLAFQTDTGEVPVRFDLRVNGRPAAGQTFLGRSLASPANMPFTEKSWLADARVRHRPHQKPEPPYFLVWFSESGFGGEAPARLSDETERELRALGYIQ